MAWHSWNQSDIIDKSPVATISLGSLSPLQIRYRDENDIEKFIMLELAHGSIVMMKQDTQKLCQYQFPSTTNQIGNRVNITFLSLRTKPLPFSPNKKLISPNKSIPIETNTNDPNLINNNKTLWSQIVTQNKIDTTNKKENDKSPKIIKAASPPKTSLNSNKSPGVKNISTSLPKETDPQIPSLTSTKDDILTPTGSLDSIASDETPTGNEPTPNPSINVPLPENPNNNPNNNNTNNPPNNNNNNNNNNNDNNNPPNNNNNNISETTEKSKKEIKTNPKKKYQKETEKSCNWRRKKEGN